MYILDYLLFFVGFAAVFATVVFIVDRSGEAYGPDKRQNHWRDEFMGRYL